MAQPPPPPETWLAQSMEYAQARMALTDQSTEVAELSAHWARWSQQQAAQADALRQEWGAWQQQHQQAHLVGIPAGE